MTGTLTLVAPSPDLRRLWCRWCSALAKNAVDLRPGMILVFSENGKTPRLLASGCACNLPGQGLA